VHYLDQNIYNLLYLLIYSPILTNMHAIHFIADATTEALRFLYHAAGDGSGRARRGTY